MSELTIEIKSLDVSSSFMKKLKKLKVMYEDPNTRLIFHSESFKLVVYENSIFIYNDGLVYFDTIRTFEKILGYNSSSIQIKNGKLMLWIGTDYMKEVLK